jgi:SHS family lactate transporter-like MFS transporter
MAGTVTRDNQFDDREDNGLTPLALLRPHWRLVLAAFLGWFLDAFDQVALLLVLPAIGKDFGVSLTLMGLVITAQSLGRIGGNIGWGWLADRYGRRLAFMAGVIWFAACSGLTGLAWTYGTLVFIQFCFGIGFGGEWTASAALLMESVPRRARAVASSLMMAGYEVGFFAASGANALLTPHFGWRALFFVGIAPALLAIFIRLGVAESPVWLRTRAAIVDRKSRDAPKRFRMDAAAWQACLFMAMLQFMTASLYSFYPTLLETVRHFGPNQVFAAVAAYSIGSILGKLTTGRIATRFGHRPTILGCLAVTILGIVPFAAAASTHLAIATAFVVGASSSGIFALVPHYLSLRFTNAVRSFGMGLAYAVAALAQAVAASALPALGGGLGLALTIEIFVIASSLAVAGVVFREPKDLPGETMDPEPA